MTPIYFGTGYYRQVLRGHHALLYLIKLLQPLFIILFFEQANLPTIESHYHSSSTISMK